LKNSYNRKMGDAIIGCFKTRTEAVLFKDKYAEKEKISKYDLVIFYERSFLGVDKPWSSKLR